MLVISSLFVHAQQEDSLHISIHQLQNQQFRSLGDSLLRQQQPFWSKPSQLLVTKKLELTRKVFGWHPYWASATAYQSYDYDVLTHLSYFSYETDTLTGGYKTINGWDQTPVIDWAHQRGVKVMLTVTNFGTTSNNALLKDTLRQNFMIKTLIALLKSRNGDGVNFDLELVSLAHRANLVAFIGRAVKKIKAELPDAEISMATPAVDWSGSWDLPALAGLCNYLIVMGYDYYYSGSATAGPVAPLEGESYNITKTINTYLNAGVPPYKLMLGTPWFGYNWPVVSSARKATVSGKGVALTYMAAVDLAATYGKTFDEATKVPWLSYKDASNIYHQAWFDDATSYGYKYNLVNARNLAGIGIWALSYEKGDAAIWNGIKAAFSTTGIDDAILLEKDTYRYTVFPNPSKGLTTVQFNLVKQQKIRLKLTDIAGKTILYLLDTTLPANAYSFTFDVSPLQAGCYLLVLTTNNRLLTSKIIVVNR
jgi:spore germination protein YaaH